MTGLSAAEFRLNKRGTISEGHHADLVLFNFERIHDCATFENPKQMASGIEKVWVNGILSYDNGRALNAGAGVFLYRTDKPSTIAP
jgi:N-acyl-D-amino-acid deacylase